MRSGFEDSEFEIVHDDTLTNDWDILRELDPAKKPAFDAIVANPPFSYYLNPTPNDRNLEYDGTNNLFEARQPPGR